MTLHQQRRPFKANSGTDRIANPDKPELTIEYSFENIQSFEGGQP